MKTDHLSDFRFSALTSVAQRFSFLKRIPLLPILLDEQIKCLMFIFYPFVFYKMTLLNHQLKVREELSTGFHRFGGLQFHYNNYEVCHLHSNGILDIKLDSKLKKKAFHYSFVEQHHFLNSGNWISIKIKRNTDINQLLIVINERVSQLQKR